MIITLFFGHEALVIIFLAAFELTRLLPLDDSCSFGDSDMNRVNRSASVLGISSCFSGGSVEKRGDSLARGSIIGWTRSAARNYLVITEITSSKSYEIYRKKEEH